MFYNKIKILYVMSVCLLIFSGCAVQRKENGKAKNQESSNNENTAINSSQISDTEIETNAGKSEDAWGLDDIKDLFDIWEWRLSSNPTNIENIANMAGYSPKFMEGQIENAEEALTMLPDGCPEISFYTEESEKQFISIEWYDYVFNEAKTNIFSADNQGLWGYSYLCNSLQKHMEDKPAIFVTYYYQFETRLLEIVEILEASEEIVDYASVLYYEDDGEKAFMRMEDGIRLLNPAAELNPYENVFPTPGLEGKELERYTALVFLDIVRNTHNLVKYEKILSEEAISLLQQLVCYYEKPEEIYDFVKFGKNGDVTITSQFQPTLWGSILIDIDMRILYDMETGKIDVDEGQLRLSEKP